MNGKERGSGFFRLADLFIIIVFLSIAAFSLDMFRHDLLQTISLQNVEPVGTIIIKKNTVQRRISDRVLWDRLARESPVYIGDLIRVAEISAATLYIDDNSVDIEQNTLIRISRATDGEGLQLVLSEGALSLAAGTEGRSVSLDLNGVQVQAGRGAVLSAGTGSGGISVQVNEGNAQIVESGGTVREIPSGTAVAVDAEGTERPARAAVVTQPAPNARYVKHAKEPLTVNFSWNRVNLVPGERLRLEIASDRNFNRVSGVIENLDAQARAQIDTGFWYWRLSFDGTALATGSLTIADGSGPGLQSPAFNSLFRYRDELPLLNFQWARVQEAVSYIVEVSRTADFSNPQISRQSSSVSMTDSTLGEGTWYWRVMPVFPQVFSGSAVFSTASFFRIERIPAAPAAAAATVEEASLPQWLAAQSPSKELPPEVPPEIIPPQFIRPPPPQINLSSPAQGTQIAGLTALRQQTVFRWDTAQAAGSRFVLSRNADPLLQPVLEIQNPDRVISIDSLTEGTWYWTVEIQTQDGITASAPPGRLQVLPIPLLPAPQNLMPARGTSLGLQDLRSQRTIAFNWSAVQGANAYIFTLYRQTTAGGRQIVHETINSGTSYTFADLRILDRGDFVWQVEAVNVGRANEVEQRGATGESTFIIDFPSSSPLQVEGMEILHDN